jgi:hypothetical protein
MTELVVLAYLFYIKKIKKKNARTSSSDIFILYKKIKKNARTSSSGIFILYKKNQKKHQNQ